MPAKRKMLLIKDDSFENSAASHNLSQSQGGINEELAQDSQLQNDLPGGQRKFTFTLPSEAPL